MLMASELSLVRRARRPLVFNSVQISLIIKNVSYNMNKSNYSDVVKYIIKIILITYKTSAFRNIRNLKNKKFMHQIKDFTFDKVHFKCGEMFYFLKAVVNLSCVQ